MKKNPLIYFLIGLIPIIIFIFVFFQGNDKKPSPESKVDSISVMSADSLVYVGRENCKECHKKEYELWQDSHHDLAMQIAEESTVLGNFENTSVTVFGVTSTFFRKNGKYYVKTEGPDGNLSDFEILYTFGITPLQQYLIEFPGGRLQTLPLCWDIRPKEEGGQRWFHIYPDEHIKPNDILFWTKINQNWNHMCAECHSTNLRKNYDYDSNIFKTSYAEIDVSCESCHGPGSAHVVWAEQVKNESRVEVTGDKGLRIRLKDLNKGTWIFRDMEKGSAERSTPLSSSVMVEMCGRCHARRANITDDYIYGQPLLQTHRVPPVSHPLYYDDGQIKEEVYVYGSFLQSKMYHKGVICSDCHEPHSTKVYVDDNSLCFRCHLPSRFDTKEHHFHKPDDKGGSCRDCHMPETTYMVIDPRRDHSIRLPRPDLSQKYDSPNACNQCHQDKDILWSIDYMNKWYGPAYSEKPHFAEAFNLARRGHPNSAVKLGNLIQDKEQPNIVRATALSLLSEYLDQPSIEIVQSVLYDKDPLIRLYAIQALQSLDGNRRFSLIRPLLEDPVKTVRLMAAYILSDIPKSAMTNYDRAAFDIALTEYIQTQKFNGERPESNINLAILYFRQDQLQEAEAVYKKAIEMEPAYTYSYINLADLYRQQGRDAEGKILLEKAIAYNRPSVELYHSLGLLLTRQKRRTEAMASFKKAAELDPENGQLQYYWALSLMETGQIEKTLDILANAHKNNPYSTEILFALATIHRDQRNNIEALKYAEKLYRLSPQSQDSQQLFIQIQGIMNSQQ